LERDLDNLRAALDWCRTAANADTGLELAVCLERFWLIRGYYREGSERLADLMAAGTRPPSLGCRALQTAAQLAADLGDLGSAATFASESLDLARTAGDRWLEAQSLILVGYARAHQDPEALLLLAEGLATAQEVGDAWLITEALATNGFCRLYHGDPDAAIPLLSEAMILAQDVGDPLFIGELNYTLGLLAVQTGDVVTATLRFDASLTTWTSIGHDRGIAMSSDSLGRTLLLCGQPDEARPHLLESLRQRARQSTAFGLANALEACASFAVVCRRDQVAARLLGYSEALRKSTNLRRLPAFEPGFEADMRALEAGLGSETFAQLLKAGNSLDQEQAIAEAASLF